MTDLKQFSDLVGQTVKEIKNNEGEELIFVLNNGESYKLYHEQDCCESVRIEDIVGNLEDLLQYPILMAEEVSNSGEGPNEKNDYEDSYTWTFYKLATVKGYVTIRWYGSSNGYYSESVDFCKIN